MSTSACPERVAAWQLPGLDCLETGTGSRAEVEQLNSWTRSKIVMHGYHRKADTAAMNCKSLRSDRHLNISLSFCCFLCVWGEVGRHGAGVVVNDILFRE